VISEHRPACKVNFHHGLNFVSTKSVELAGEPRWADVPELDEG
jgi:hypothetical protein